MPNEGPYFPSNSMGNNDEIKIGFTAAIKTFVSIKLLTELADYTNMSSLN